MSSVRKALFMFGWKQTLKGAIVIGLLIGSMTALQGIAYAATYPTPAARAQFAASLESAPALGILYGETKNLTSAEGYMAYRTIPAMGLIASIWTLMILTKLLRGQEETGRMEIITAGATTSRQATLWLAAGASVSFLLAYSLSAIITAFTDLSLDLTITPTTALLVTAAIFLPALLFGGVGLFVSQLSRSKRRALMYGFGLLLLWFALRSIGNTMPDLYWLKNLTAFGWADRLDPVLSPDLFWLLPFFATTIIVIWVGLYLVAKRDLGLGIITESDTAKSRFILLGSPYQFSLRQQSLTFISWGIIALGMSGLMAAITNVAAQAVAESPALGGAIIQLAGSSDDLKIAILGTGLLFTVIILLIMATVTITVIRSSEAKGYTDTLFSTPLRRSSWLVGHFITIVAATFFITFLCAITTWLLAQQQAISLELNSALLGGLSLTGIVIFLLGVGFFLYGIWPKVAAIGMYAIIIWSFLVDLLESMLTLPDIVVNSSLFHYVSLSLTDSPNWTTFTGLALLGISLTIIGIASFTKRDMAGE